MAGIKQVCAISGGLLVVAATWFTALAEDVPDLSHDIPVAGQAAIAIPAVGEPKLQQFDSTGVATTTLPACPQSQSRPPGFIARFKQRWRAKCWGYPEEFNEPPLGTMLLGYQTTQIANGVAARMALYQYDFLPDSDQLNPRGKAQLAQIACWLPTNDFPVYVEPIPTNPVLEELRRQAVWIALSGDCLTLPPERIMVGSPNAYGLGHVESLLIDRNRLSMTGSRGVSASGGGTSGTSTSSSGSAGTTAR